MEIQTNTCKMAFTLAEVLITLGIIGVIAALTIPTLLSRTQEIEATAKLKKAYAALESSYRSAVNENGTPDTWNLIGNDSGPGAENLINTLAPYLKIAKNCGVASGCFPDKGYQTMSNTSTYDNINSNTRFAKAQLADGSIISALIESETCSVPVGTSQALMNTCGWFYIDINGFKEPNRIGYDTFEFEITKYGIIPAGSPSETYENFPNECSRINSEGFGCAAWVIYVGNMDYQECDDLSWTGKHTCS